MMQFLHAADQHVSQVIQGLGRADTDQGHGQCHPFGLMGFMHPRDIQRPCLIGKALQFGFRDAIERMTRGVQ
jgi:hypothetical protein